MCCAQRSRPTRQGWNLRRLRERVLKAGARLLTHSRRTAVVIERHAAEQRRRLLLRWKPRLPLPKQREAPPVPGPDRLQAGIALARMSA